MSNEHAPTGGEGATTDGGPSVSDEQLTSRADLNALFEVLADGQRREILTYLDDNDDDVAAFSDLIEHVADDSVAESPNREQLAVSLHHNHLPKLSEAGVVEYDDRSEMVRYRGGPIVTEWVQLAQSQESDLSQS